MSRTIKALVGYTLMCIVDVLLTGVVEAQSITLGQLKDVHSHAYWAYVPSSARSDSTPYTYLDMTKQGIDREYAMCSDIAFTLFVDIKRQYPETLVSIHEVDILRGRYKGGYHAMIVVTIDGRMYFSDPLYSQVREFPFKNYKTRKVFLTVDQVREAYP